MLPLLLLITAAGLIWRWLRPKTWVSVWMPVLGLTGIALYSWPLASWVGLETLEWPYRPRLLPQGEADAIVVLASYSSPPVPWRPYQVLDSHSYHRCLRAAWLYKHWRSLPVLACGGRSTNSWLSHAAVMRDVLEKEGVPADRIWTEERSMSTHQNALFAAHILRRNGIRRIALVTEAYHMLRAERCFRRQGLDVLPAPCRFERMESTGIASILPTADAMSWNDMVLHEWIGLAWYQIRGWN